MSNKLIKTRVERNVTLRSALKNGIIQDWRNTIKAAGIPMPKMRTIPDDGYIDLIYMPDTYFDTPFDPYRSFETSSSRSSNTMFRSTTNESILSERLKEFTFHSNQSIPNQKYMNISTYSKTSLPLKERYSYNSNYKKHTSTIHTSSSRCSESGFSDRTNSIVIQPNTNRLDFYGKAEKPYYASPQIKEYLKPPEFLFSSETLHYMKHPKERPVLPFFNQKAEYINKPIYAAPKNPIYPAPKLSLQEYTWRKQTKSFRSLKIRQPFIHTYKNSKKPKFNLSESEEDIKNLQKKTHSIYKKKVFNYSGKSIKMKTTFNPLRNNRCTIELDIDEYNADSEDVYNSD
ncbi:unnamed protein product [Pneumocystis jirovecii]|uniref:Uncharacterized protein n=1 Tax=Pneumocystis jirovecii TaxID=42068 RepID=L0PAA0_PNEJI|nr:unnamed protein product [Pneumocystis jirovecii]